MAKMKIARVKPEIKKHHSEHRISAFFSTILKHVSLSRYYVVYSIKDLDSIKSLMHS